MPKLSPGIYRLEKFEKGPSYESKIFKEILTKLHPNHRPRPSPNPRTHTDPNLILALPYPSPKFENKNYYNFFFGY
jgi:hypothetical protein